jgi:hypothetical protein
VNKIISTAVAGIAVVGTLYMRHQFAKNDQRELTPPDVRPGAWFCYYLGDFMTAHPGQTVVYSSPLELANGSFAWATNTPEWDRAWFAKHGHSFPAQWVRYDELSGQDVQMVNMGGI